MLLTGRIVDGQGLRDRTLITHQVRIRRALRRAADALDDDAIGAELRRLGPQRQDQLGLRRAQRALHADRPDRLVVVRRELADGRIVDPYLLWPSLGRQLG